MNEIAIKQHSFEIAKNRLKDFSEKTEADLLITAVPTDSCFGIFDYKVTGEDLNKKLSVIQGHFVAVNEINNKIIREFREIYNALDVLDKDYITSIVANVKAIEKTSNDVRIQQNILKQHNEKLENQQNKLDMHQVNINKSVESISKIVNALKVFKDKLEEYRHLNDIDQIWRDIENHSSMLAESKRKEEQFLINLKTIEIANNDIRKQQDTLKKEKEKLEKQYIKLDTHQSEIDKNIENVSKNITVLKTFKDKLDKYEHLNDIDQIWKNIENHSSILDESRKREEILLSTIQKNKVEGNKYIIDITQRTNDTLVSLTKKVNYAYWLTGSAIGLAIFELILLLKR